MNSSESFKNVIELIKKKKWIFLTTHKNPDGDAIGSLLSLTLILKDYKKNVFAFLPDKIPEEYTFLTGLEWINKQLPHDFIFDLAISVDCADKNLLPFDLPLKQLNGEFISIDHHLVRDNFWGDLLYYENVSAVGEQIYKIAKELNYKITLQCAEAIYVSILTDTGSFRYSSTTSQSHEIVSELLKTGVDPWKIASNIYESWPLAKIKLLGKTLESIQLDINGSFAYLVVTQSMIKSCHGDMSLTENFVNFARSIKGVEVAAIIKESNPHEWRISFRSRGKFNVARIANKLGGGGHFNASGCTVKGSFSEVKKKLLQVVNFQIFGK